MSKILISLVSDQAFPNAFLIKNYIDYDEFVFITTEKMEDENKINNIVNAFPDLSKDNIRRILVDPNDIANISKNLENAGFIFDEENEYLVNVTGGNKMMFLAVYNYFADKENTVICYLPIRTGTQFISLTFGKEAPDTPKLLTLDEYVKAYGVDITSSGEAKYPHEFNINFKEKIFSNERYEEIIRKLIVAQNDNGFKKKFKKEGAEEKYDIYKELLNIRDDGNNIFTKEDINDIKKLCEIGSFEKLTFKDIRYITGYWFEEYVYQSLKNAAKDFVNEEDIRINVEISNPKNELDVMFFYKNDIYIIECKTRIEKSFILEAIYKQRAIYLKFGLNAGMYFFTMDKVSDELRNRAKAYNITFIGYELLNTENDFLSDFGGLFKN